jgi:hypothetical protein
VPVAEKIRHLRQKKHALSNFQLRQPGLRKFQTFTVRIKACRLGPMRAPLMIRKSPSKMGKFK